MRKRSWSSTIPSRVDRRGQIDSGSIGRTNSRCCPALVWTTSGSVCPLHSSAASHLSRRRSRTGFSSSSIASELVCLLTYYEASFTSFLRFEASLGFALFSCSCQRCVGSNSEVTAELVWAAVEGIDGFRSAQCNQLSDQSSQLTRSASGWQGPGSARLSWMILTCQRCHWYV